MGTDGSVKPDCLSSIPVAHVVEGKSYDFYGCPLASALWHMYPSTIQNKYVEEIKVKTRLYVIQRPAFLSCADIVEILLPERLIDLYLTNSFVTSHYIFLSLNCLLDKTEHIRS